MTENLWQEFLKIIREDVGSRVVETWFKAIKCSHWDSLNKTVYLQAPNQFVREWVVSNYEELCKRNLARLLNVPTVSVVFVKTSETQSTKNSVTESASVQVPLYEPARVIDFKSTALVERPSQSSSVALMPKTRNKGVLNEQYRFESFVVGPSNTLAFSAAQVVSENPGCLYNPLFMYGSSGLGKTHLLHAIGNAIKSRNKKASVLYQSADRFVHEFISSIRMSKVYQFEAKYKDVDVLLIDDVQFISNKEQTQETFFHIFNMLHQANKQIVFTSDSMPRDIAGLAERMRSRLEGGLLADIQSPTVETMVAIIQKKGESFGQQVPDDVAHFIASRGCCNVRELEGMLMRVMACASLGQEPLSFELATRVLSTHTHSDVKESLSLQTIAATVAKHFGYSLQDLRSEQRNKDIAQARHIAFYLMKKMSSFSLREMGKFLERKDHSTVMYAYEKISKRIEVEAAFSREVQAIERKLAK